MPYNLAKIAAVDKDDVNKFITGISADFTDSNDQSAKIHKALFTPPIAPVSDVYLAIRKWADSTKASINNKYDLADEPAIQVGQVIPAAPAPAPPTAEQTWQSKASTLRMMQETKQAVTANGGSVNAAFTATINQLATDVGNLFVAGFES